ncbi:triose-phosphate transporter family-domain-containing protein [Terfezia claveryi]|nr:triose-phosphate transporter family-domain-containing protein [Terfezia claveryi]
MHKTDSLDASPGTTTSGCPPASSSAGRLSITDSESEDLELSSWESDASNKPINKRPKNRAVRESLTLGDRMVMDPPGSEGAVISQEDRRTADAKVIRNLAVNAFFIGLWYTFSLLISIYNKWMFSPDHLNFKFPLFVTCGHMLVQFSMASLVLFAFPHLRPGNFDGASQHHGYHSGSTERQKQQEGKMTKWFYLTRIGPCGAATGLDIGLGNMSMRFISLAFYTMCKSSAPIFVLTFAFIFRLEKPTWMLAAIITIMTVGVIMMVSSESETTFVLIGFILVMTASALSGLRWALTQVLLVRNPATSNPFSAVFFLAPVMFISILCVAVPVEGFGPLFSRYRELVAEWGFIPASVILVCPGLIAFLMVASEFALLQRSSVVTLSVAGIFKEVITITAAAIVFGDSLTPVNISGLAITIASVGWYNWWKIQRMRAETLGEATDGHAGADGVEYVAVGEEEEEVDKSAAEDSAEDGDAEAESRRRRKRKFKGKSKFRINRAKGKGNRRAIIVPLDSAGQLLDKLDEAEESDHLVSGSDDVVETVKRGIVSSGSGAEVSASKVVEETASVHGEVRLRSGSLSSVESEFVKGSGKLG